MPVPTPHKTPTITPDPIPINQMDPNKQNAKSTRLVLVVERLEVRVGEVEGREERVHVLFPIYAFLC